MWPNDAKLGAIGFESQPSTNNSRHQLYKDRVKGRRVMRLDVRKC